MMEAYTLSGLRAPSENFDLSHWYLTLPSGDEVEPAQLNSGYAMSEVFYTDAATGGMVFRCPNLAGTTTNSHYSRSELRELLDPANSSFRADSNNWRPEEGGILRARLRVEVGEAPRYELIKAETELLASQKNQQTAELRVNQAKAALRQQVGGAMPGQFSLDGTLGQSPDVPPLPVLRDTMAASNAELVQRRTELERARLGVDYQRSLRWPEVAVRASTDRQPDNNVSQIGLVMTIPLWDRRRGPVDPRLDRRPRQQALVAARRDDDDGRLHRLRADRLQRADRPARLRQPGDRDHEDDRLLRRAVRGARDRRRRDRPIDGGDRRSAAEGSGYGLSRTLPWA